MDKLLEPKGLISSSSMVIVLNPLGNVERIKNKILYVKCLAHNTKISGIISLSILLIGVFKGGTIVSTY